MCSAPKLQCTKYEPNRALSSQGFSYTEIQPFGATGATYCQKCLFYGILGHFWPPWRPPGQLRWVQMAPTDHPGCIPPRSNQDPLRSSHLEPPEPLRAMNARFMAFLGHFWPPWRSLGQFRWVQMALTNHPGCIPPRSNQVPLRSSHLETPEPLMAINACFMAFLGLFWPPWKPQGQFWWVQMAPTKHPGCIPPRSN